MIPRIRITGLRAGASDGSVLSVLQNYTGMTTTEIRRILARVRDGERVEVELDDEYAAYDLAGMLADLRVVAEVEEAF